MSEHLIHSMLLNTEYIRRRLRERSLVLDALITYWDYVLRGLVYELCILRRSGDSVYEALKLRLSETNRLRGLVSSTSKFAKLQARRS